MASRNRGDSTAVQVELEFGLPAAAKKPVTVLPANLLSTPLAEAYRDVAGAWQPVTEAFAASDVGRTLASFVDQRRRDGAHIYPAHVFRALELTAPADVRVVILGQDPYHGPGQAQGLAFSVAPGNRVPPSLRNMLKEVKSDMGRASQCRDDLTPWAAQGVLLLNTVLTVEDGAPQSHAGRGWEVLTGALLAHVAAQSAPVVFLLWGASAQRKRPLLERAGHCVLTANHPSPLSANRPPQPFIGCRHFSQANAFLVTHRPGLPQISW